MQQVDNLYSQRYTIIALIINIEVSNKLEFFSQNLCFRNINTMNGNFIFISRI